MDVGRTSNGDERELQVLEDAEVDENLEKYHDVFEKANTEPSDAGKNPSQSSSDARHPPHRTRGSQGDGRDRQRRQGNDNEEQRRNNAFSVLLVRANTSVPTTRVELGSGSWREAIGELVGCPEGNELTTVRTKNHARP